MLQSIRLPAWLSTGMVFQQGVPLLLYGHAREKTMVKLEVVKDPTDGRKVSKLDTDYGIIWSHETRSGEDGKFSFELPAYKPSTDAYTLIFSVSGETISVKDLRCGDVWLLIGSVPLSVPIADTGAPRTPLKDSALQLIRFFISPRNGLYDTKEYLPSPVADIKKSTWISARAGQALAGVSSVGFSLAYHLADQLHYPIGMIDLALADSPVYGWISRDSIEADQGIVDILKKQKKYLGLPAWENSLKKDVAPAPFDILINDKKDTDIAEHPDTALHKSEPVVLPSHLSAARDMALSSPFAEMYEKARAVSEEKTSPEVKPLDTYEDPLAEISGKDRMTVLYNHKLFPLHNMNLRGIIFAPDVKDCSLTEKYDKFLEALLYDLSNLFGPRKYTSKQSIPSLIMLQLKPAMYQGLDPYALQYFNEGLCAIRRKFPMKIGVLGQHDMLLPDRAMSFYVGRRLSSIALGLHFTPKMPTSSPECVGVEIVGSKVLISFDNTIDGLKLSENESILRGFSLCGADRVYRPAQAKILHGVRVMVWHEDILEPRGVTYGFSPIPHEATFRSRADLPVLPFRFDRVNSTYSPDLSFTFCDRLSTIGMDERSEEFALLPMYTIRTGSGRLFLETLNKTEGAGSLRFEYVPQDNIFSFGPILSYPSIMAPLDLSAFRRVKIDIFNPDLQTKYITINGFAGEAEVSRGLKWQTIELEYEEGEKLSLSEFVISVRDDQPKGSIYFDNIRFIP